MACSHTASSSALSRFWTRDVSCPGDAGVSTRVLRRAESQTIFVTLRKGKYLFLDTRVAHAKSGMKGLLGVGVGVPEQPGGCLYGTCIP